MLQSVSCHISHLDSISFKCSSIVPFAHADVLQWLDMSIRFYGPGANERLHNL